MSEDPVKGVQQNPEPPDTDPAPRYRRRSGGVVFGTLLVVVGSILLVTRLVPGFDVAWWALWPLIIVVAGVVQLFTPGDHGWGVQRVFEGLGTVIFGLVLLGNTTGYISWGVWWIVVTLWPALVIAGGLAILSKGLGRSWLGILATLVIWLTLAYAVALSWTGPGSVSPAAPWARTGGQAFAFSESGSGVTRADFELQGGAGDLTIDSGQDLVTVDGTSPFGAPVFSAKVSGSTAEVKVGVVASGQTVVLMPGTVGARVETKLSDSALWDVVLETGASSLDADLSDVRVRDMEVRTGVSSVTIKLGEVPSGEDESTLLVKSGVSSVRILIPRDAEARFRAQSGLVANDIGGDFERSDGEWQTPGYDSASKSWNIRTEAGIGSVSIDTY